MLTWYDSDERKGYDGRFIRVAETVVGNYRILKRSQGGFEVYLGLFPFSEPMDTREEAEAWAQSNYECWGRIAATRSGSASATTAKGCAE